MKRIFYSLAGEGLGHAGRTQAVIDNLNDFEIHLFTWGEAYDFYAKQQYPHLHRIVGIPFGRKANNRIDIIKTTGNFVSYLCNANDSVKYVLARTMELKPDLFVSDFEGILPIAAKRCRKPLLSIDNQHKFSRTKGKGMPFGLRFYSFFMGLYSEWMCPYPDMAIISTFYHSVVKKRYCTKTILTNCFMRKAIENTDVTEGDYVLVYYKSSVGPKMLEALTQTNEKVIVFNCPLGKRIGDFEYHDVDGDKFIKSLAGCKAVFCASGNQLLGEAAFYGKPTFTIPEPNQAEQRINAYYIAKMNYGVSVTLDRFEAKMVTDFLANYYKYGHRSTTNGVYEAVEQIRRFVNA